MGKGRREITTDAWAGFALSTDSLALFFSPGKCFFPRRQKLDPGAEHGSSSDLRQEIT